MINEETFKEMLSHFPDDADFVLKVVQADVILTKSTPKNEHYDKTPEETYVEYLVREHAHNGITKNHYDFAVALSIYQNMKDLNGLGGSNPKFPEK